ncbi:LysR family transcriptional regulator [Ruminococcaceae bacterium AF10-16]|jgi:DNA-binding transcriptional LysR family regulator|nr:LysR family transcriptional regulator [Ruminococcaceae bacterium AF10-16]
MLADLEQKWGMTLLERSKSGVCLTSAGEPVRPFLLLEYSGKAEVSDLLERAHVQSDIHFTAWEDFAITAMVERSLGVSILPGLILQRIPYKIEIRSCSSPITTQSALL